MVQVCARALGIPYSKVHISEMATNTVANASPTAASVGADLHGMAIKNACEQIKERLAPYTKSNPKATWEQWVCISTHNWIISYCIYMYTGTFCL